MNRFFSQSFVTVEHLTGEDVTLVFRKAEEMRTLCEEKGGDDRLKHKILAALFYEPSTRTFSSFISAMQRLGGGVIPLNGMSHTSVIKGETLEDTVRVFSSYADILVMRHPDPGSIANAVEYAAKPIINAGDGIGEHPTQALIDAYTIENVFGKIDGLHILLIGDLAHYRPTNSLSKLLALYPNVKISMSTPKQVPMQEEVTSYLKKKKVSFKEYSDFQDILPEVDVLYVTRVKKEYMSESLYKQVKGSYIVDKTMVRQMKKKSIILHCLPRVDEIHADVDSDPRSLYLTTQVRNGLYVRMALLDLILRKAS
ncbi:aspartate carbamoyltransferase [Candidatus Gottesmanbacteria bacterium]|nr:aspartate carbamoyltransferase [Candidatus Gottesmanbacteria bacterium]